MRILVSGGAGFIGSHTAEALRNGKHNVLIVDNFSTGKIENILSFQESAVKNCDICVSECDIDDFPGISDVFASFKPEAVIHLAAQSAITTAVENPVKDCVVNAVGTLNMLKAAVQYGVKRFVFSSTSAVYKEYKKRKILEKGIDESYPLGPSNPYGISKLAAEMYVRLFFPNHVILRYGNVFGPRQVPIGENQVIPRMIRHFLYGDEFYIHGSGEQSRDFVFVGDVVRANTYALLGGNPGTYNVASGKPIKINEIAQILEKHFLVPDYKWDHTDTEDARSYVCLNNSAALDGLNWYPQTHIWDGIDQTIKWWKDYKNGQGFYQS